MGSILYRRTSSTLLYIKDSDLDTISWDQTRPIYISCFRYHLQKSISNLIPENTLIVIVLENSLGTSVHQDDAELHNPLA